MDSCGSAFEYLTRELHLAEGTAWNRVNAMRLVRRFPRLAAALEDGRLNTTQLGVLGPVLTEENVDDLVRRATHLSKEKTKELAVSIRPREVPADGLRKLPAPAARPVTPPGPLASAPAPDAAAPTPVPSTGSSAPWPAMVLTPASNPAPAAPVQALRPLPRSRIEPVAAERWQWTVALDAEREAKLDRLKALLAHRVPDGDLGKILDVMLDDALEKEGKRSGTR